MAAPGGVTPLQHPTVVIDASVWASRLMPQDGNHIASIGWMSRYTNAGGLMAAPAFLLIELSAAITRQTGQAAAGKRAANYIYRVSQMRLVQLDALLVNDAANMAADLHLRAGDATYVTVAHQMRIPLVSWDREQIRRASSAIAAFTPDSFPF